MVSRYLDQRLFRGGTSKPCYTKVKAMYEMEGLLIVLRAHTGRNNYISGLYTTCLAKLRTYNKELSENRPVTNPEAARE
jgi:hypothetical protein